MKHISVYIFLLLMLSAGLTSCGIKPSGVDAPAGAEESTFPNTYPDISTDTAPSSLP